MVGRLLTLDEVADLLRLPKATLYRQRYSGDLPGSLGFKVGRHVRYDVDDVGQWIDAQKDRRGEIR
jgi:excisionase family DNA binding protein